MKGSRLNSIRSNAKTRFGLALDLGTTVIKGARVDLDKRIIVATARIYNPQNAYGADVMTRISAALDGQYDRLRRCIMAGVRSVKRNIGFTRDDPGFTAVAGNPVMSSFYVGRPVFGLARYPYTGAITRNIMQARPRQFVFGSIGGFVGGDTIAGLLASGLIKMKDTSLYIDLGTNGEIALVTRRRIYALSAAAGPAFEGAGLTCGSLAVPGAVDAVALTGSGRLRTSTIGGLRPHGFCASGLIDLLALLLRRGWLTGSGRLLKNVKIAGIVIKPVDIRQLQLAIGAIRTGVQFLMEHAGVRSGDIADTVITGEFGSHLNTASLKRVGLIPRDLRAVRHENDLPLKGAVRAMCEPAARTEASAIRSRSRHLELAMQPDFQKRFVAAMHLAPWKI